MTEIWAAPEYNLRPRLKNVKIPTLVITADHEFIPISSAEHITEAIPNARMVTLKDCGHFSYLESPVDVREQIDALLHSKVKLARPQ